MKRTDRQNALGMWTYIYWCILNDDKRSVQSLKRAYAERHKINWERNCVFCERYEPHCYDCPLARLSDFQRCGESSSLYDKAQLFSRNGEKQTSLEACLRIIEIIEETVR